MNVEIKGGKGDTQKLIKRSYVMVMCRRKGRRNSSSNMKSKNKNQKEYFMLIKVTINRENLDEAT